MANKERQSGLLQRNLKNKRKEKLGKSNNNLVQPRIDFWFNKRPKISTLESNQLSSINDDGIQIIKEKLFHECVGHSQSSNASDSRKYEKRPRKFDDIEVIHVLQPQCSVEPKFSNVQPQFLNVEPQCSYVQPQFSNVEGFPLISKKENHHLLKVLSIMKNDAEEESMEIICEYIKDNYKKSRSKVRIRIRDVWTVTKFVVGSIINLIEPLSIADNVFEVSLNNGLLILEPEILLSPTSIQQSLWCSRKAFFQDRFRGFPKGTTLPLLLGSIIHELFQVSLLHSAETPFDWILEKYRSSLLPTITEDLNEIGFSPDDFESEILPYISNVCEWLKLHAKGKNRLPFYKNDEICDEIIDIEENYWSNTIGIKGKVDVSFTTLTQDKENNCFQSNCVNELYNRNDKKIVCPLELKTGKPHEASSEHQAQVLLYSLLLSERWNDGEIVPGFLLYLKNNKVRKILPKRADLLGLLLFRNKLVPYFSNPSINVIPAPLNDPSKCSGCPYSTICSLIHKKQSHLLDDKDAMKLCPDMENFLSQNIAHLNETEIDYAYNRISQVFSEWSLHNETSSSFGCNLFRQSPRERQSKKTCMANMLITSSYQDSNKTRASFLITFTQDITKCPIKLNADRTIFNCGQCVIVSTDHSFAVLMGMVYSITANTVTIRSDKMLPSQKSSTYHIDKYNSVSGFTSKLAELASIMENDEEMAKLRSILHN